MEKVKELKKQHLGRGTTKGFVYNQIAKSKHGYIYDVYTEGLFLGYEIFERKIYKAAPPFVMEDKVAFPSNEAFGEWAWTTESLERAKDILKDIDDRVERRLKHEKV